MAIHHVYTTIHHHHYHAHNYRVPIGRKTCVCVYVRVCSVCEGVFFSSYFNGFITYSVDRIRSSDISYLAGVVRRFETAVSGRSLGGAWMDRGELGGSGVEFFAG